VSIDFFKEGNELKEKTIKELNKEIDDFINKNESMVKELEKKEETFSLKNLSNLDDFLTKELSFILTSTKDDKKIYKFMKNKEEYSIEISSYFIKYSKPNKYTNYARCIACKNNEWKLERLNRNESFGGYSSYVHYDEDISKYLKQYNSFKDILDRNTEVYNTIKEFSYNDLFVFKIKESSGSISIYDKDCKEYSNLLDFIKEIL